MDRQRGVRKGRRQGLHAFLAVMAAWLISGCAGSPKAERAGQAAPQAAVIEDITARSSGPGITVVEILNSRATPFTTFKLVEPSRVVLDIAAVPGARLPKARQVDQGPVSVIEYEQGKAKPDSTRVIIGLSQRVDYKIEEKGSVIALNLISEAGAEESSARVETLASAPQQESLEAEFKPTDPRIFFQPGLSKLNEVLGVDFTLLEQGGRSRLTVTTEKAPKYALERKGPKSLLLILDEASIRPLLQRHLDSTHFEGAVDVVKADFSDKEKRVYLDIRLREMVPFHVDQTDGGVKIEFGRSGVPAAEKKILPLKLVETQKVAAREAVAEGEGESLGKTPVPTPRRPKYRGAPMTMDFVNADVTNILRLIGEVSNLNIVWGPEVQGKVSMRLKNVPWDQALELILANNNLGMRRDGNVIWVTTRAQMAAIEAEERRKQDEAEKRIEEERKKLEEREKRVEEVRTEYITINYVDVENVKNVIDKTVKSASGKLTVDKESKTIIMTDAVSNIANARTMAKRLDRPTKQVMIEARIVEASTSFSRNLGVQWNYQMQHRDSTATPWTGTPPWGLSNVPASYPADGQLYNPSFSTNHPSFISNLGLALTTLSGSGLTGAFLNAQIAFSESEGEAKILSSPKIVTRDTVKAMIQQGTKIVLPSGTDANGNKTYELVDASLKLEVTPKITPNDMVVMEVSISDDFPDYANARGENVPINTKNANTTMMVSSGDTVIIGGIFKENKGVTETGQPWIKDIPFLGWLFKSKGWNDSRTELLIFLTPTVMPSG